jgi:hypothetical protein
MQPLALTTWILSLQTLTLHFILNLHFHGNTDSYCNRLQKTYDASATLSTGKYKNQPKMTLVERAIHVHAKVAECPHAPDGTQAALSGRCSVG